MSEDTQLQSDLVHDMTAHLYQYMATYLLHYGDYLRHTKLDTASTNAAKALAQQYGVDPLSKESWAALFAELHNLNTRQR